MALSPEFQKFLEVLRPGFADPGDDVAQVREKMAEVHGHPFGDDMEVVGIDLLGVPAAKIAAPEILDSDAIILHLHGGAFVACDLSDFLFYGAKISRACALPVVEIGYRLAPEYPCPAAAVDCAQAIRGLVDQGYAPEKIALIGDSCGGGLLIAALTLLRASGDPLPACGATLCGWFDLEASGASAQGPDEPFLSREWLRARGRDYVGTAGDLRDPLASPLYGDLSGLPPLLLQAGGADLARDDAIRLAEKAQQSGSEVTLDLAPGMIHGWHGLPVPEADAALARVKDFFAHHLD